MRLKALYISAARALRWTLRKLRILSLLDRYAGRRRTILWARSLLAIYDGPDMFQLDVPWWTFEASDVVADFLASKPGARVFEWGSGASTLWLAKRAETVTSVEHDREWAGTLRARLPDNVKLALVPAEPAGRDSAVRSAKRGFEHLNFRTYVEAIDDVSGVFDLIVIDGRAREACLGRAVRRLAPGGLIVFDNVDRERYMEALLRMSGKVEVHTTRGLTPGLPYPTRTALVTPRSVPGEPR